MKTENKVARWELCKQLDPKEWQDCQWWWGRLDDKPNEAFELWQDIGGAYRTTTSTCWTRKYLLLYPAPDFAELKQKLGLLFGKHWFAFQQHKGFGLCDVFTANALCEMWLWLKEKGYLK